MAQHIGLLGGTFNPIHYGHLRIAEELLENLSLHQVRFIPSANPPHKDVPKVTADNRALLVEKAIADNPNFVLDTLELHRTGASYTIDTLRSMRNQFGPECSISFIMGSDAFVALESWHEWQSLLDYCHIVLVNRPQEPNHPQTPLSTGLQQYLSDHYTENPTDLTAQSHGLIHMQSITPLMISSTLIRDLVKQQHSIRYLTSESVIDSIKQNALYRS